MENTAKTNKESLEAVMNQLESLSGTAEPNSVIEEDRKYRDISANDLRDVLVDHLDVAHETLADLAERINSIAESRGLYADNVLKTLVDLAKKNHGELTSNDDSEDATRTGDPGDSDGSIIENEIMPEINRLQDDN